MWRSCGIVIAASALLAIQSPNNGVDAARPRALSNINSITLDLFQQVLTSELDHQSYEDAMTSYELEADFMYQSIAQNAADISGAAVTQQNAFVICHSNADLSGFERKNEVEEDLHIKVNTLYNGPIESCFSASMTHATLHTFADADEDEADEFISMQPMTSYMKMRAGTVKHVEENAGAEEMHKKLVFDMCPGAVHRDVNMEEFGLDLLDRIQERDEVTGRSLVAANSFPWTSDRMQSHLNDYSRSGGRKLSSAHHARVRKWRGVMDRGLNAEHKCADMFDELEVESDDHRDTLAFTLGHGQARNAASATSSDCVLSLVAAIAAQPEVCSVESVPMMKPMNDIAQWITQSGVQNSRPFWDSDLTGAGQIIQVSDSGLDTNHCSFWDSSPGEKRDGTHQPNRRKVIKYEDYKDDGDYSNGHGTHVVGSIIGHKAKDGVNESSGFIDGMAKDAKVSFFDIGLGTACCYVPGQTTLFSGGYSAGSKFHSASWGAQTSTYNSNSRGFDNFAYNNKDFLPFVAAGNSGSGNALGTVGAPATAKNIISVGASESDGRDLYGGSDGLNYLAYFSSRGPTSDGRRKPDIVSPGHAILSAKSVPSQSGECEPDNASQLPNAGGSSSYAVSYKSGTSMATPVASGTAALVRQYFTEGYYPNGIKGAGTAIANPSASLIKAVMLNGAQSLIGKSGSQGGSISSVAYYDEHQGFGRIQLSTSLPLDGTNDFALEANEKVSISQGDEDSYSYQIGECSSMDELSIMLVWTDPAGSSGCAKCLINDLDLTAELDGTTYYPNGRNSADTLNNAERIRLPVTPGDTVSVTVTGTNLATSSQEYALVVTGCFGGESSSPGLQEALDKILQAMAILEAL
uniref:subtilisin n=1 Tax=Leptocylindrus danicus TaxID=163516 RepID=A0A7S2JW00_9STRA|mmetsp:Transcript_12582/g.18906  ORF Transcript_12582/g.18906 Transcript_12582/m.18906 type:complete len:862 (+) Transcript_12582:130-2715(+)